MDKIRMDVVEVEEQMQKIQKVEWTTCRRRLRTRAFVTDSKTAVLTPFWDQNVVEVVEEQMQQRSSGQRADAARECPRRLGATSHIPSTCPGYMITLKTLTTLYSNETMAPPTLQPRSRSQDLTLPTATSIKSSLRSAWSGTGSLVAITCDDSFYILRFNRDAYNDALAKGVEITDEGVEEAFEVVADASETVKTAKWMGDCFIYMTATNRLAYFVRNKSYSIRPFDTYALSSGVVEYQTAVLRDDMDRAADILPALPEDRLKKVARFLEGKDLKELALHDHDHKFDSALQTADLDAALDIARAVPEVEAELKWKSLGDRALAVWRFELARECFTKSNDLTLDAPASEAALFARTQWSRMPTWRLKKRPKIATTVTHPKNHADLFEKGCKDLLAREQGLEPSISASGQTGDGVLV
ncbi:coatomer WD associated region-domain-containing protein [Mycena pura]|uniref:Coatomer WD associated region-domain-containing protein n=1 Tax=Mycena pura TaxID=153505 RepID=A0AAD6YUC1_9AGAR|nr:coatomer WD associated region-domain-containing protein [Mycena pura]